MTLNQLYIRTLLDQAERMEAGARQLRTAAELIERLSCELERANDRLASHGQPPPMNEQRPPQEQPAPIAAQPAAPAQMAPASVPAAPAAPALQPPLITAEHLLAGMMQEQGLRVHVRHLRRAAEYYGTDGAIPDLFHPQNLDAQFAAWDHWRSTSYPDMSEAERAKLVQWMVAHYEPAAKAFDAAVKAREARAGWLGKPVDAEAAFDAETGELIGAAA